MDEPRRTRLTLLLGVVNVGLLLVIVAQFAAHRPKLAAEPGPAPQPAAAVRPPLPVPAAPPTLRRSDIVSAVAEEAAAFAEGRLLPEARGLAPGRRFQVVIPFNCMGQGVGVPGHPAAAAVDAKRRTVTLTAAPEDWSEQPWLKQILGAAAPEAVEGFWVPRPWITGEVCPAVPIPEEPQPAAATPPTLGLVQVFYPDGSRVGQRGARPYRVVRKLAEDEASAGAKSYRLVLAGRIAALVDNRPVRCFSASIEVQPTCVVGVEIDKVRFEEAAGGAPLAEWAE